MDLVEFLRRHPLDVTAEIHSWQSTGPQELNVELRANPWWMDERRRGAGNNGVLKIHCRGIEDSCVRICDTVEVNAIVATRDHPRLWRFGTHATIYGSARLAAPAEVLARLLEVVEMEDDAGYTLAECLGARVDEWMSIVSENSSYLLLSGPLPIVTKCARVLKSPHTIVVGPELMHNLIYLQLEDSVVVCSDAAVAVDPPLRQ